MRRIIAMLFIFAVLMGLSGCENAAPASEVSTGIEKNESTETATKSTQPQITTKAETVPTTVEKTTEKETEPQEAQYIGDRRVEYDEANHRHIVYFSFYVEYSFEHIKQEADISIKIVNQKDQVVYDKTTHVTEKDYYDFTTTSQDLSHLYGVVYIKDDEIKKGQTEYGTLTIGATLPSGNYFEDHTIQMFDLPLLDFSMTLKNKLPVTINGYDYSGKETSMKIESFQAEKGGLGAEITLVATMTYNKKGNDSNDYARVSYKIKDSEGMVVSSGDIMFGPLAVGDKTKETEICVGTFELGEKYTIELLDYK